MTNRPLRIIYAGNLTPGLYGTCEQRLEAMRDLGHDCVPVHLEGTYAVEKLIRGIRSRCLNSRYLPRANRKIRQVARSNPSIDVVWIDKALELSAGTFGAIRRALPGAKIVGYTPDDMINPNNQTRELFATLPLYDVYFTTKSYNVSELMALGARRVEFVDNAYHPKLHRPMELTDEERERRGAPVGFIGNAESQRALSIAKLADAGIEVKVWGDGWEARKREQNANYAIGGSHQYGDDFARTICAFDINLGFLRKENRDLQTTRSIEIPACGAFMLAERTDEHQRLFTEGVEAEFFSTDEELLEKVRYYLAHPDERRRVAAAGRERCLRGGYNNQERIRRMIELVNQVRIGR